MLSLLFILFVAGVLTILLPCILPLLPIVLGTSIAGRHPLRPLGVVAGMVVSFVGFTLLLNVALAQFPEIADIIRIATYDVLLLFGVSFLTRRALVQYGAALFGATFFLPDLRITLGATLLGLIAVHLGSRIASAIQNIGARAQKATSASIGTDHPLGAFLIGSTLGLVWVPCAGPALGFVFTLLRDRPGIEAAALLTAYGSGTALPLLAIGYGGQYAAHSVRSLSRFTGRIKQVAGLLLITTALALQYGWLRDIETWLVQHTSYGTLGTRLEERFFGETLKKL